MYRSRQYLLGETKIHFMVSARCKNTVTMDRFPKLAKFSGLAFDRVWHAGLFHKLKSYGISGQIFGLISSFLSNRRLRVILDGKSSHEYPVNAGVPQGSIYGPILPPVFLMMLSVILQGLI